MRRWAFIVAMLGMFVLVVLLNRGAVLVSDYSGLENLELNSRVVVSGEVVSEKSIYGNEKVLTLDSGLELVCESVVSFNGERVEAEGLVGEYEGRKQVEVEKIFILN